MKQWLQIGIGASAGILCAVLALRHPKSSSSKEENLGINIVSEEKINGIPRKLQPYETMAEPAVSAERRPKLLGQKSLVSTPDLENRSGLSPAGRAIDTMRRYDPAVANAFLRNQDATNA